MLISFLVRNMYHVNGDVMKENVLSVCTLLRRWCSSSSTSSTSTGGGPSSAVVVCVGPVLSLLRAAAAPTGGAHAAISSEGLRGVQCRLAALTVLRCLLADCKYPLISYRAHVGCCCAKGDMAYSCGCKSDAAVSLGEIPAATSVVKELLDGVLECIRHARKEVMVSGARTAGIVLQLIHARNSAASMESHFPEFCTKFEGAVESIIFEILAAPKTVSESFNIS